MANKILITGGSGLIGKRLAEKLVSKGYEVVLLSRNKNLDGSMPSYIWDLNKKFIDEDALKNVDFIVHLAGAGVASKRWTEERKRVLTSSRVDSAQLLFNELTKSGQKIKAYISASAIGIYGFDTGGILQTEERTQLGDDFLATLTKKWEHSADQFVELSKRVIKLRIGLVLSEKGGLLDKLIPVSKLGLSSAFGSGEQYMSWIHIDDLVEMFIKSIEDANINGAYNAVAPNPVTNKEFLKILSRILGRPFFMPNTPKFLMKAALGELASAVTGGNRVSSKKIEGTGFSFQFPTLKEALSDLLIK